MARTTLASTRQTIQIKKWLGLNESPDGDTKQRLGEASVMRNFRVTRENNLQVRSGYALRHALGDGPVRCLWDGYVNGESVLLAVCSGHLWRVDADTAEDCGSVNDGPAFVFGFAKKAYLLAGGDYYAWDGATLETVAGYAPLVAVAAPPAGGGTLLEAINKLTGKRRQRFSPDGSAKVFQLAETGLVSVDAVERGDGVAVPTWTANANAGTVTFAAAPSTGTDCLTITYTAENKLRAEVTAMRFAELYGGTTDNRVFLYGDGSNRAIYSDLDSDGQPSAEYFPDLNVLDAGSANTPITGMIRHFSRLIVFKLDGAWSVSASTMTLSDNSVTAAFYLTPVQRDVGNAAPGQVRLVYNNPRTAYGGAVYDWKGTNSYITSDERVVKRVSQRVESTLSTWDLSQCIAFDDDRNMEWYLLHNGEAMVHNYGNDSWYYYDNLPAVCMERHGNELYFGTPSGEIMHFSRSYRSDAGAEIDAYWESGAMDFGMDWRRKYSADIWVSIKPESRASVNLTMKSNRKSDYMVRTISSGLSTFSNMNFAHFSFGTNREPQVRRVRVKVKKFTYATLIFFSKSKSATATILGVDFKIRYTGDVK